MAIGLWGNIFSSRFSFANALVAATVGTTRGASVRKGSSGHADDVDEQCTSSSICRRSAFENARVIGEIIAGELRVAKFHYQVRYVVATKDRERGIRIILQEAVLSLTPQRNELAGLHMPGHARRTVGETYGHRVHSLQDELSLLKRYVLRVLHEENNDVLFRLFAGGGPGYQRIFIGRFGWRLRIGRG